MIYSVQQIKYEILAYIKEFGGDFSDWYVGVSADPKNEMFNQHHVDKEDDIWLYKQALTFKACKTVQEYFLEKLNTDGKSVINGTEDTDCVFLYKKSNRTSP
ncbi:MAG: hypothetical protein R8G33_02710 [Gammaproteobacteria bacterium]|nr:hypothetical protein [Gammaproteobacteria bacterium]